MSTRHLVLIGEMGVGKTTVGQALAGALDRPFFDSDRWIEETEGRTGAEIAEAEGVPALHRLELHALEAGLAGTQPNVIAAAASVTDTGRGREAVATTRLVWLDADETVLAARRSVGGHRRTQSESERAETRSRRQQIWHELALMRVETSDRSAGDLVAEIVSGLPRSDV